MPKRLLYIIILLTGIVISVHAQKYECWLDGDYNHRMESSYSGDNISTSMDVSNLASGLHYYNIRIQYDGELWGPVNRYLFIVSENNVLQLTAVEYWIDEGFSMTQSISGSTIQLSADISQLEPGTHQFYCRVQASNGTWSDIYVSEFTIEAPVLQEAFIEYYIDIDPGYGNANVVKEIEQGTNKISVDLANTKAGAHVLYLRSRDEYGRWSSTVARPLYVCKHADIVALEYFFDSDDQGCGNATQVALPSDLNSSFTFEVPLNHLKVGEHLLNVRVKRSDGLWSVISSDAFIIEAATSINGMSDDMVPTITYSLKGYKVTASKGVNIVRDEDGKTKKTINK
jgi:hypothetical protein